LRWQREDELKRSAVFDEMVAAVSHYLVENGEPWRVACDKVMVYRGYASPALVPLIDSLYSAVRGGDRDAAKTHLSSVLDKIGAERNGKRNTDKLS